MRKIFQACLFVVLLTGLAPAFAAAASSKPVAASGAAVSLTPEQARQALDVLNDPRRRAQVVDTLHAIAAAGALSAPPASATLAASAPAPASAASGAASIVPAAFQSNGLASQLAHQGAHWAVRFRNSMRGSIAALLDVSSVRAWWNWQSNNPQARSTLWHVLGSLLAALLPALALEWLARRLLRRAYLALTGRRDDTGEDAAARADLPVDVMPPPADQPNAAPPLPVSPVSPPSPLSSDSPATPANAPLAAPGTAARGATAASGKQKAQHHWTLLRRLPHAVLTSVLRMLPLAVFVGTASALMSILTDDGTPQDHALDSLIDIYVLCRMVVIVSGFFLQPTAPHLRLLRLSDAWALFVQRWVVRIVSVCGIGSAFAEIAQSLGLNDAAHLALMKVVALIGHIMISILILQCASPVGELIRKRFAARASLEMFGNALADAWAWFAVFVVMALWVVWALDVQNGYHTLLHLGGFSLAILVGARLVSIVIFGALAKLFNVQNDQD
ncbi:MAG TPA: mechanosensitive ion channel protein, partial [Paraburkholderia sp.]|nr:mechanosensitive ion channel protein [Paraburkholderia sp.]